MTVSEYIVNYLNSVGVTHFFGYQGTMIAYFVDAVCRNSNVENHVCYNEQGAALAACGYAKATGKLAVAYATSGPGAINLLQGVADAYFDSAPVLFITGQLNASEYTDNSNLRQQGFQQVDIISISKPVTKMSVQVRSVKDVMKILPEAIKTITSGRIGPVLIDLPMDLQRQQIEDNSIPEPAKLMFECSEDDINEAVNSIIENLTSAEAPVFLFGNGVELNDISRENARKLIHYYGIPSITTMLASDLMDENCKYHYGFIGYAYGSRYANFIIDLKADLIISFGAKLCPRQIGLNREKFAENAKIIRIDIDSNELRQRVHEDDISFCIDANRVIEALLEKRCNGDFSEWNQKCAIIKARLENVDDGKHYRIPNEIVKLISRIVPENSVITCDVGQHQVWVAQSFRTKKKQKLLFSGGHGAMGFALPAAIGASFAPYEHCICISGDGSFQMNIQELQWVVKEKLPVKVFIMNNHSLGLIRQQQDSIFAGRHYGATDDNGFSTPNFSAIATAYGIKSLKLDYMRFQEWDTKQLQSIIYDPKPWIIDILIDEESYAYPKTSFGQSMNNQYPYVDSETFEEILAL